MTFTYIKAVRFFLLVASTLVVPAAAQESQPAEAQEFYKHENYGSALPLLVEQLKKSPENALLNYQAGVCYLHSRSLKARAVEYLEKAVEYSPYLRTKAKRGPDEAPEDVHKLLGDAYSYAFKFEPAVKSYEVYKSLIAEKDKDNTLIPEVDHRIDICRHMKDYRPAQSIPVSAKTGSPCGELVKGSVTRTLSPDKNTMIYTVRVPLDKIQAQDESGRYFEELNVPPSKDSSLNKKTSKNPIKELVERDSVVYASTIGTSHDGQVMLTYRNDDGDGNIYISRLRDNRWSAPSRMKKCANTAGWEPFESLSADGNYLYFSSDRSGGYGGWDIYRCKKQADGQWSKAVNLGPGINTAADELAPFIYADGVTLFFSSNRIKPGSYDIFSSTAATASLATNWGKPVNVGFPVNRNASDIFQVNADNKVFGSTPGGPGSLNKTDSLLKSESSTPKVFRPDRDNYLITFTGQQKIPLNLRRGTVTDEKGESPAAANISVIDNGSGEVQGKYHTADKNGQFAFVLPASRNLQILYEAEGYLPQSENINLKNDAAYFEEYKAVRLEPLKAGATVTLNNVFFENDKTTIDNHSKPELQRISTMLRTNPGMSIELTNIVVARENGKFNKRLSKARARELKQYFVKEGISKKRVEASGKRQKPPKVKETRPDKRKPKTRKPEVPKEEKPVQVLVMKISEIKEIKD